MPIRRLSGGRWMPCSAEVTIAGRRLALRRRRAVRARRSCAASWSCRSRSGPSRVNIDPLSTSKLTSSTAGTAPKSFRRPATRMAVIGFPVPAFVGDRVRRYAPSCGVSAMLPLPVRPNFAASAGACLWKQHRSRPDFLRKASSRCAARQSSRRTVVDQCLPATERGRWMSMLREAPSIAWPSPGRQPRAASRSSRGPTCSRAEQEADLPGPGLELRRAGGGDPAAERLQGDVRRRHADHRQPRRGRQPACLPEPLRPSRRHGTAPGVAATLAAAQMRLSSVVLQLARRPGRRALPPRRAREWAATRPISIPANHGLTKLRVASRKGVIFATFRPDTVALEDYLDEPLLAAHRPAVPAAHQGPGPHAPARPRQLEALFGEHARSLPRGTARTASTRRSAFIGRTRSGKAEATGRGPHSTGATYGDDWRQAAQSGNIGQDKFVASYLPGRPFPAGRPARFQRSA